MTSSLTSPFKAGAEAIRWDPDAVLRDYRVGIRSRQCSITGRLEVFSGKAKFGIFGDGKEVAQLAMAYAFKKGDFRSGYYRDQTFMFALGLTTVEQFFAQLYAHADLSAEPYFGGRAMTAHFATRLLDPDGSCRPLVDSYNSAADLSPTAAQMPRLVGLAYASKLYRDMESLHERAALFSSCGNEVAFGTIGNASCAEGLFWESVNAIGVLQVPALLSIWDDAYGISVPNRFQMTKGDIARILEGFQRRPGGRPGIDIYVAAGWNYAELCETYLGAAETVRSDHVPAIIHVTELTQPLGHSTSGSHERYKTDRRLRWEQKYDCLRKMREWIAEQGFATLSELDEIDASEKQGVLAAKERAWNAYRGCIESERKTALSLIHELEQESEHSKEISDQRVALKRKQNPHRREICATVEVALRTVRHESGSAKLNLAKWKKQQDRLNEDRYGSHLYSQSPEAAVNVTGVPARYSEGGDLLSGYEILNRCFDAAFERYPGLIALGEDVGLLGGVNQGWAHLQEKYGKFRISDTGVREATILGQAIGMALRGFRPIAEIQYLDYILYALEIMSDDLASLHWRTRGGQKAPVIIRTRGHRLEGIWHSGSPMAGIVNLIRGIYVCVPRDSTQAAGFYNTILQSDDPALIVEVLNGYRKKTRLPDNIADFAVPLGVPEIIRQGGDVTVVTYGACCEIAQEAAQQLSQVGIEVELIDVRTLLPFDTRGLIGKSLQKTSRILFLDEDLPGGTTALMMREVLELQRGYDSLDAPPRTLSAKEHRPAYGSDGDYFSKPNREDIFSAVYGLMHESDPRRFPLPY